MGSLFIAIDDDVLAEAERKASEQGRSIDTLLREFLERFAGTRDSQRRAAQALHELADRSATGSDGRSWTREDLYDRVSE